MNNFLFSRHADVAALCRRLHVRRLDAFGSAVRGGFNPVSSDLDFLVEFEPLSPAEYADAYFSLKEGLEALYDHPVDLITTSAMANPYFRESIDASREQLYAA
jgi:uncharacterized protein